MGYTTDFEGQFDLDKPLTPERRQYLVAFNETRRVQRDPRIAHKMRDPKRTVVKLGVGPQGAYFVGGLGFMGQDHDESVVNSGKPPEGQPGLWCQWRPSDDGTAIVWDEGEKFYDYVDWLSYLIAHFLAPWGYKLNGEVTWQGESTDDIGKIVVKDNVVTRVQGRIVYDE